MEKFNKVYEKYKWLIDVNARKYSKGGEAEDELKSMMNTEFWLIYQNYDSNKGELETFLNISLQRRVLDYINLRDNKFNREATRIESLNKDDDEEKEFEIKDDYNITDHVLDRIGETKTDEDKRQLIDVLIENVDSATTAIVNEILENADAGPTAIGRKLGIHHQTVRRKLDALARKYYANHDEDIREYLAV